MPSAIELLEGMIAQVAIAIGPTMLRNVAFIGGCTTGLLVTDPFTKEGIRYTEDVDLIVNVVGYVGWAKLQNQLKTKGFSTSAEDDVICRMRLGDLKVDFLPDDDSILGFANRWYKLALASAVDYDLTRDLTIRVVTAPCFIATKYEAYKGRGGNDPLASHDFEDILNIIDGRPEVINEIETSIPELRIYLAQETANILTHSAIEYAIEGFCNGTKDRANLIFEKLEHIANG